MNNMESFWTDMHKSNTYFDCGSNYEEGLNCRYGKYKHSTSKQFLESLCLTGPGKHVDIENGSDWKVLEIGCGYGGAGAMIAPFVLQYDGVDVSANVVKEGNQAIKKCKIPNMKLIAAPTSDVSDLMTDSYDFIFTTSVFIHTEREVTEHYLKETRRLLKDGGTFCHQLNVTYTMPVNITYKKLYRVEDCEQMFEAAGLDVLECADGPEFMWDENHAFARINIGTVKV